MKLKLSQNSTANVDSWTSKCFGNLKWFRHNFSSGLSYAGRNSNGNTIHLHKLLMWCPPGYQIDHINGDGLDNRLENLRIVTPQQNRRNMKPIQGTSKFKGVYYRRDLPHKRWCVRIYEHGKCLAWKRYNTEIEAAKSYDKLATQYYGEYAKLNFPNL